jgi:uncharacterized iron-regulated membrane protein
MTAWRQWVERPQGLWIRRIIFQLHLWVGIGVGIYVAVISISGSAIVFRRELERGHHRMARSVPDRALDWLTDLHDNLLSGLDGRTVNGIGAFLVVWLACTGAVIWWPGIRNWKRSLTIQRKTRLARFNWDLHSAAGFWCLLLVLTWGISGINLCFPGTLNFLLGDGVRLWMNRLHFGRFNAATEAVWTIIGLAPAVLAVTGAVMWWNRVVSKKFQRWRTLHTTSSIKHFK